MKNLARWTLRFLAGVSGVLGPSSLATPAAEEASPSGRSPKIVVVIPSQGCNLVGFSSVALGIRKTYSDVIIVITKINDDGTTLLTEVLPTSFHVLVVGPHVECDVYMVYSGTPFCFEPGAGYERVIIPSHGSWRDGPNMAAGDSLGASHQPWPRVSDSDVLTPDSATFWSGVGQSMASDGKIVLLGCKQGRTGEERLPYADLVAKAAGRTTYAPWTYNGAANWRDVVRKQLEEINAGTIPVAMKKFNP